MDREEQIHWQQLRALFDEVSELPREQWREALLARCDDAALIEEVFQLLRSQTVGLSRASSRLDIALARAVATEYKPGDRLGPWRLLERIAAGGMGTVFKAERADGQYRRVVAIKLLHALSGKAESEVLTAERQVLADLQLPQVANMYDGGSTPDGYPYLVMEFIEGVALDVHCRAQDLGLEARLRLFMDVCRIVQSAHEQLVVHCDLKPSNVLVGSDGKPVLMDFGLARMLNDARHKDDRGYCTPAYASPELLRGERVGAASDVFSLGVMLVELLSDRPSDRQPQDLVTQVVKPSENAAPELRWRKALVGDLDAIAMKACALSASSRYGSVEALAADLQRYLDLFPVQARDGGRMYYARKTLRRNWRPIVVVVGMLSLIGIFVYSLVKTSQQAREEAAISRQISEFLVGIFETADPYMRSERGQKELTSRQLLDRAAKQVARDLNDAPAQRARLQSVLGVAYRNLGVPRQAEQQLQQAIDGFLAPGVNRPADAAASLAELSLQNTEDGDGATGLVNAERGLSLLPKDTSIDKGHTAAKLQNAKGLALTNLQQFDKGEAAFKQAELLYRELGTNEANLNLREVKYNLGLMYLRWGKNQSAVNVFNQVLDELDGRRTSIALAVETRLAQAMFQQGRYEEAKRLLTTGVKQATELYGPESSFLVTQHDTLADLHTSAGEFEAARGEFEERLRLSAIIYGVDSLNHSMGLHNYGALQVKRGDIDKAESLFRRAIEIRMQRLGENAPMTLRGQVSLAELLIEQERMQEAGELLRRAERGLSVKLPADAPARFEAGWALAKWHVLEGNEAQAMQIMDQLSGARVPPDLILLPLQVQAELAELQGRTEAAIKLRGQAVDTASKRFGKASPDAAEMRIYLAELLLKQGRKPEALKHLRLAYPTLRSHQVAASPLLRKAERLMGTAGLLDDESVD